MPFYSRNFKRFLDAWPGKRYFGLYRFLPIFFVLGAALEFSMINWHVGNVNFWVTWPQYLKLMSAAMLTMFAGAQVVHYIYKPLDDMEEWIEREKAKVPQKEPNSSHEKT